MPLSQRKRQARLAFSPLPPSSPASAGYNEQIRARAAAVNIDSPVSTRANKRRRIDDHFTGTTVSSSLSPAPTPKTTILLSDSDSDDSLPPRSSNVRPVHRKRGSQRANGVSAIGSSPPLPTIAGGEFFRKSQDIKRSKRSGKRKTRSQADELRAEPQDNFVTRLASDNLVDLGSDSDESSDIAITPMKKRTVARVISDEDEDEDEDEDDMPRSSVRKRLRQGRPAAQAALTDDVRLTAEDGNTDTGDESEHDGAQDDSGEDSDEVTLLASRQVEKSNKHHAISAEEQQELENDVAELKSSSSDDNDLPARSQPTAQQKRQAALDRLKKSRARKATSRPNTIPDDESEDDEPQEVSIAEDDDHDSDMDAMPTSSIHEIFGNHESDDEMLDDDDDNALLGAPADIPLAFTKYASMKPKDLFQYAVEWMVQKKLNPGFNGEDEIYGLTFGKLDDEVKGLAGSKFESSAWTPNFLVALRARPEIAIGRMDREDPALMWKEKCDACNRSGHIPTYEIQFQGLPYHSQTLENVEQPEDSDDSSEDDSKGPDETSRTHHDAKGNEVLPQQHSFYVGKFCKANAETAHSLQHWRYHLYEWVVSYLQEEGHLAPKKIVKRDAWGEPKRRKYANKVVDQMVETGKTKQLYRDFKHEVGQAREAQQQGRWNRGSP